MTVAQLKRAKIKCDVYCKVVGYCRKLDAFNAGKKNEFKDKKFLSFKEDSVTFE